MAILDAEIDLTALRKRTSQKWARYARNVLPAFVAETDFPVPDGIARVLHQAIDDGDLGYAEPRGLGEAYASFARERYGCEVDPHDVFALPEVMVGVAEILRVVTDPGDGIVINPPVYPPFFATIREVGRAIVEVPLVRLDTVAQLDFEALEDAFAAGARVYLFCNPHNPTGRAFSSEDVRRVAALAQQYGVVVLSDEIHGPLVLPGAKHVAFESVARECGAHSITLTSASKGWNIAGLKCAIAVSGSSWGRDALGRLPEAMAERTGHLGVMATVAAFTTELAFLDRVVTHLAAQRENLREVLKQHGLAAIRYVSPDAGFLAWLDCRDLDLGPNPSAIFLERGEVALVSGLAFGREGAGCVRFNFGTSSRLIAEAVARMERAVCAHRETR